MLPAAPGFPSWWGCIWESAAGVFCIGDLAPVPLHEPFSPLQRLPEVFLHSIPSHRTCPLPCHASCHEFKVCGHLGHRLGGLSTCVTLNWSFPPPTGPCSPRRKMKRWTISSLDLFNGTITHRFLPVEFDFKFSSTLPLNFSAELFRDLERTWTRARQS